MNEAREDSPPGNADSSAPPPVAPEGPTGLTPPFARDFPDHPELRRLVTAFELGRHDVVREGAPRLAESTDDPEVARAARELRRRLDADPLAVKLLVGAFVLLALLTAWAYLTQGHGH